MSKNYLAYLFLILALFAPRKLRDSQVSSLSCDSCHKKLNSILENKNILKKIGNEYLSNMKEISSNAKTTTDKLPINFLYIGLIKLIQVKFYGFFYLNASGNSLSPYRRFLKFILVGFLKKLYWEIGEEPQYLLLCVRVLLHGSKFHLKKNI